MWTPKSIPSIDKLIIYFLGEGCLMFREKDVVCKDFSVKEEKSFLSEDNHSFHSSWTSSSTC